MGLRFSLHKRVCFFTLQSLYLLGCTSVEGFGLWYSGLQFLSLFLPIVQPLVSTSTQSGLWVGHPQTGWTEGVRDGL